MKKFLQKFILTFISVLFLLSSTLTLPAKAYAQESTWYNQGFLDWYTKVYSVDNQTEIFGERYTAAQVQWILYSLFSFPINMLGRDMQAISSCVLAAGGAGLNVLNDSACMADIVSFVTKITSTLQLSGLTYNPNNPSTTSPTAMFTDYQQRPLSGIKYLSSGIHKFTSIPTASAQVKGFGFGAVDGLQKYWQGFRNIAYALAVLVIIVFAFMIMFRVKISPQIVISVQSALPKIVIALVLATFSYAIAGFVIDLSYVVGGLFASLMTLAGFAKSFGDAWNFIVPTTGTAILGGFYIFVYMFGYTFLFFIAAFVTLAGTVSGLSIFGFIASLIMMLLSVVVLIIMLWYTIKVPWVLLKTLISLFLSIVVAPVQIVAGALVPQIGFQQWLKKIVAEALVFPLTGLFMFLAWKTLYASMAASLGQVTQLFGAQQQNLWAPPILGSSADMAGVLWLAISFTFILMIPKAVDIMKMLIMGQKFSGIGIGEAIGPVGIGYGAYAGGQLSNSGVPWPLGYAMYDKSGKLNKFGQFIKSNDSTIGNTITTGLKSLH